MPVPAEPELDVVEDQERTDDIEPVRAAPISDEVLILDAVSLHTFYSILIFNSEYPIVSQAPIPLPSTSSAVTQSFDDESGREEGAEEVEEKEDDEQDESDGKNGEIEEVNDEDTEEAAQVC